MSLEDLPILYWPGVSERVVTDEIHDRDIVLVEQRLPTRKIAGWVPVSPGVLGDAVATRTIVESGLDRIFRPWRYPDGNPMPSIDLFPWASRIARRLRGARSRTAAAVDVLRHGAPEPEDCW